MHFWILLLKIKNNVTINKQLAILHFLYALLALIILDRRDLKIDYIWKHLKLNENQILSWRLENLSGIKL